MLLNRGLAELIGGNLDESGPLLEEALRTARQIDDRVGLLYQIGALGCRAAAKNEPRLAARLLGATENLRAEVGGSVNPIVAPLLAQARRSATAALGQSKFDAEFKAGTRLSREAAVGLALGEAAPAALETAHAGRSGVLGNREADVARLIAEGMSNKQIGARLFISERTVDSHVHSILNKLGFNSRAQIASWMSASNQ
ncbi:MAG TPA: helix-turn-helix transcriptional regulator [Candidatus Dormibacteraeota bacterium]|nr:helix-turn-helix transcriptional regulator [Candidatus Dormibacteraeota bacterium]